MNFDLEILKPSDTIFVELKFNTGTLPIRFKGLDPDIVYSKGITTRMNDRLSYYNWFRETNGEYMKFGEEIINIICVEVRYLKKALRELIKLYDSNLKRGKRVAIHDVKLLYHAKIIMKEIKNIPNNYVWRIKDFFPNTN